MMSIILNKARHFRQTTMIRVVALLALTMMMPAAASAQSWLTLGTNDATIRRTAPGATVVIPLLLDMSGAGGGGIDTIASALSWNPAFITFDSVKAGTFGSVANVIPLRTAGTLTFDAASDTLITATTPVATLYFTAGQTSGGTRLSIMPTDATTQTTHLPSGELVGWTQDICVTLPGLWGDTDGHDGVTIIDAQQIALSSVGGTVIDSTRLANNGDVNGDGNVDILDAQGIARFVVALSAPARINEDRGAPPSVATLSMNKMTMNLAVGSTSSLVATPFDANGFTIVGCQTSTWVSSDPMIVRVNATGQLTALATGTATITATSGSATAQSVITVP